MDINRWFIIAFFAFWLLGPASQVLQLVAPRLHMKMGFMEKRAFEPEFRWFWLYERGTSIADLTHFVGGILFIWLAFTGNVNAPVFGLYVCSVYVFVMLQYLLQFILLTRESLHPLDKGQFGFILPYVKGLHRVRPVWAILSVARDPWIVRTAGQHCVLAFCACGHSTCSNQPPAMGHLRAG